MGQSGGRNQAFQLTPPASSATTSVFNDTPWRAASATSSAWRSVGSLTRNWPERSVAEDTLVVAQRDGLGLFPSVVADGVAEAAVDRAVLVGRDLAAAEVLDVAVVGACRVCSGHAFMVPRAVPSCQAGRAA